MCWIEEHKGNPGNPAPPQYQTVCDMIRLLIEDEKRSASDYVDLYTEISRVMPPSAAFFESFMAATADDEEKHAKLLERLSDIFECRGSSSVSNPGNPDDLERWKKRKSLRKIIKDLADNDAVEDALFDLRGTILQELKKTGEISKEVTGPEVQGTIDYLIRRLVFLV